eukprot:366091-Chlamydomonas_euryale.AAC.6
MSRVGSPDGIYMLITHIQPKGASQVKSMYWRGLELIVFCAATLASVLCSTIGIGPPNSQRCSVNKKPLLGQPCTAKPTVNLQTSHTLARRLGASYIEVFLKVRTCHAAHLHRLDVKLANLVWAYTSMKAVAATRTCDAGEQYRLHCTRYSAIKRLIQQLTMEIGKAKVQSFKHGWRRTTFFVPGHDDVPRPEASG